LFGRLADLPWAVFLDSGTGNPGADSIDADDPRRYHLISALPTTTLTTRGANTVIRRGESERHSSQPPLTLLREALDQQRPATDSGDSEAEIGAGLPFTGGALGWLGYELGATLESIAPHEQAALLPDMAVGLYDWALITDRLQRRSYLVGDPPAEALRRLEAGPASHATAEPFRLTGRLRSDPDQEAYQQAFDRIQQYLREGDCYQVNLTRRFQAQVEGDPWRAYLALRTHSPAPYGAYLTTPFGEVLCNSPEQFLGVADRQVVTRPIKGTRPRDPDPARDQRLAGELQHSAKDRAENIMIVDLLRNDLGRVARPGSVRVEQLCALESYATVHHLVSTISATLARGQDSLDLLQAAFPGGSITGAPKRRAMQIIRELETAPRGVYCGSIVHLDWNGRMNSNIAIRTLAHRRGQVGFHAGGGIVIDSKMDAEYQETLDKAKAMLRLLGIR
jgi:para-aminobenzoate synthetase component 1